MFQNGIQKNVFNVTNVHMVCPHAVIRPFLLTDAEKNAAPSATKTVAAKALKTEEPLLYSMGITPLDCTGCGNCAQICPATRKSISYETTRNST